MAIRVHREGASDTPRQPLRRSGRVGSIVGPALVSANDSIGCFVKLVRDRTQGA